MEGFVVLNVRRTLILLNRIFMRKDSGGYHRPISRHFSAPTLTVTKATWYYRVCCKCVYENCDFLFFFFLIFFLTFFNTRNFIRFILEYIHHHCISWKSFYKSTHASRTRKQAVMSHGNICDECNRDQLAAFQLVSHLLHAHTPLIEHSRRHIYGMKTALPVFKRHTLVQNRCPVEKKKTHTHTIGKMRKPQPTHPTALLPPTPSCG